MPTLQERAQGLPALDHGDAVDIAIVQRIERRTQPRRSARFCSSVSNTGFSSPANADDLQHLRCSCLLLSDSVRSVVR